MTVRSSAALVGAVALVAATAATAATAGAATVPPAGGARTSGVVANPYDPAHGHPYRHGAVPTREQNKKMKAWAAANSPAAPDSAETLSYGGGIDGIGVQSGHSKVYVVFDGTQWGTSSTDANGNLRFSNDSAGAAGAAQQMFRGIGTNGERWSADLTQWCDGPTAIAGGTICPNNANFIPYQAGGVLAGVWYDNSAAEPQTASGHQLGQEAVNAAAHFGNTTAAANRDAYYVIMSARGTNPDSYQGQYCAWHDYTGDTSLSGGAVSSPYGDIAFSNQPYNIDSGANCGVGFVNSPGVLDGYTITLGHEWHEMMSDQNPAGGWTNHTTGEENSDECAWLSPGSAGGAANVSFGGFGTYAEQASWSNDTDSCAIWHSIVPHTGHLVAFRAHANNSYVTADNAGASALIANRSAIGPWETFNEIDLGGGDIALNARADGDYVTAENAGASPLIANRAAVGAWETFRLIHNADGSVSFLAQADNRYVTAENAGASALIANRTAIGPWEEFDQIEVGVARVVSFRAHANGDYVTAENAGASALIANRTASGLWEQFDEIDLGGGYIALNAHADNDYVTAENAGADPLIANRTVIGSWETFLLVHNADGSVSLKANANGDYVTAENAGASALIANRTAIGQWEEFDLIVD